MVHERGVWIAYDGGREGLIWWMKVGLALAESSYVCSRTCALAVLDSLYQSEHPKA